MSGASRPDVPRELSRLKDFQRATVEHVHRRLWLDDDRTSRFLVADEVGLGKTMVARGVIATTIDHLWEREERIDIVYICSNTQIAKQNLRRLNVGDDQVDHADRLTLLPKVIADLKRRRVNFVSFTPGTSFNVSQSGGRADERVLLYRMLTAAWGQHAVRSRGWPKFFRGSANLEGFENRYRAFDRQSINQATAQSFADDVARAPGLDGGSLQDQLLECVDEFRYTRGNVAHELSRRRYQIIGRLRSLVAHAAVHALEPDLVILDEFQRFKALLDPDTDDAGLAQALFDQPTARVLLLSATPFKMYTLPDEPEGDDHYDDFLATVRFLAGDQGPVRPEAIAADLRTMRHAVFSDGAEAVGRAARDRVQLGLRQLMTRTERVAASAEQDAMVREVPAPGVALAAADVRAFRSADAIARVVDRHDVFEYWRSAPYLFNLMDTYQIKKKLSAAAETNDPDLRAALTGAHGLLDWAMIRRYEALDPGNAKMRGLVHDVLDRGAWQLAWLPPSTPYYTPTGAYADRELQLFTKRLVFSAWAVVPKAIAVVLSYEAERRGLAGEKRTYDGIRPAPLLRFSTSQNRPAGMSTLGLLYPSVVLARLGDPLEVARKSGGALPVDREELMAEVRRQIDTALETLPSGTADDSRTDQRWYWAAPFLLDGGTLGQERNNEIVDALRMSSGEDGDQHGAFHDHVNEVVTLDPMSLGRRPDNLADVLARKAIAGPGICVLRAVARVSGGRASLGDQAVRTAAFEISWALRAMFNRPEIMTLLRSGRDDAYWLAVLDHCLDGNLQAVLDEYLHVLVESEGLQDKGHVERAERLARVAASALTLRTASNEVDDIRVADGVIDITRHQARTHLAARFGRAQAEDAMVVQRENEVRVAFNSPFWPFVLASTSVGQEGLDFHQYSHAVVHWNLPGNPVDLEQREGRVHRYKGHAIRKNVAAMHSAAALDADDPWEAMFDAAATARREGSSDLTPYWLYAPDGGARIERYVPTMPLSKEYQRYQRLLRTVGAYRLVLGQPRQEDLVRYIGGSAGDLSWMRVDLTPPPATRDLGGGELGEQWRHDQQRPGIDGHGHEHEEHGGARRRHRDRRTPTPGHPRGRGPRATAERGASAQGRTRRGHDPGEDQDRRDLARTTDYPDPVRDSSRFVIFVDLAGRSPEYYMVPEWWFQQDVCAPRPPARHPRRGLLPRYRAPAAP